MRKITNARLVLRPEMDENIYKEIKALAEICQEYDEIKFKLELDFKLRRSQESDKQLINSQHFNELLYYNEEQLIGYIGICDFGAAELEVTGMVHPAFRNQGVFTKLYQLVRAEFMQRAQATILLLCHQNASTGLKYIAKLNATLDHAEYDMYLNPAEFSGSESVRLTMEKSPLGAENLYVGKIGEQEIGQVRIEVQAESGDIYGLEVIPEFRGQGYGRELLNWAIKTLINLGVPQVYLQVDTVNANALHLYESTGFVAADVMAYYAIHK